MCAKKLSKDMVESIKNYSNEIVTIGEFVDAVRQMPGMYIGHRGGRGYLNMIREIFQNSIDQLMRTDSPCDIIYITYDEASHIAIIEDNGMGIPFNDMIRIFSQQHTGSNYIKKKGQYSSGLHGVGSKVTNALSDWFIVESFSIIGKKPEGRKVEFIDGKPTTEIPEVIDNPDNKQGTRVSFHPTYEVMGDIELDYKTLLTLVRNIVYLTNIGNTVVFKAIKLDCSTYEETIVNHDGIISNLILKTIRPLMKPVIIHADNGDMKADIAFTYDTQSIGEEDITAFSNFCPTSAGTHITGFLDGMGRFFRDYMNKVYLNKNSKFKVNINDVKAGLKAMVTVAHLHPDFSGQAKDELSNEDMHPFVRDTVIESLTQWSQSSPADLQKVAKYLQEVAKNRTKTEEGKVKLSDQYKSSSVTGLPPSYIPPTDKKLMGEWELVIVEGKTIADCLNIPFPSYQWGLLI